MIKQILTHYKKTYTIKSYKEYINNKLTLYEKYNKNGDILYRKKLNEWQKWVYDEYNNNTYYETSKGIIWYVKYNHYNQKILEVSNTGKCKEFKYDNLNRIISIEASDIMLKIKPITIYYSYDEHGNCNRYFPCT